MLGSQPFRDHWKPRPAEKAACAKQRARLKVPPMDAPLQRCGWRGMAGDPLYEAYHDAEWGVPEYDARALWEKLVLDGFQAGLAWITSRR